MAMNKDEKRRIIAEGIEKFRKVYYAARDYYDDQERRLGGDPDKRKVLEGCRTFWGKDDVLGISEIPVRLWSPFYKALTGEIAFVWLPSPVKEKQFSWPVDGDRMREVMREMSHRATRGRKVVALLKSGRHPEAYKRIENGEMDGANEILLEKHKVSLNEALANLEKEVQDARFSLEVAEILGLLESGSQEREAP